jgi:hypothetical protein
MKTNPFAPFPPTAVPLVPPPPPPAPKPTPLYPIAIPLPSNPFVAIEDGITVLPLFCTITPPPPPPPPNPVDDLMLPPEPAVKVYGRDRIGLAVTGLFDGLLVGANVGAFDGLLVVGAFVGLLVGANGVDVVNALLGLADGLAVTGLPFGLSDGVNVVVALLGLADGLAVVGLAVVGD